MPLVMKSTNVNRPDASSEVQVVEQPLSWGERLWGQAWVRKLFLLAVLGGIWQVYAARLDQPLLLPTLGQTAKALWDSLLHGELWPRIVVSFRTLLTGYGLGIACAAVLTAFASGTRIGLDLLEILTAMLNPLPAIALLPLALLWFGLGMPSMTFVLVHAVLWPVALNTHAGFSSVPPTLRMVGRNYGLRHDRFLVQILIPAAFPSILTGLKVGWAFAWRTLIAAELVFGVSSSSGGLGWFIYENKNLLDTANVFAGLATVILIGILVEYLVFAPLQHFTIRRWGMAVGA